MPHSFHSSPAQGTWGHAGLLLPEQQVGERSVLLHGWAGGLWDCSQTSQGVPTSSLYCSNNSDLCLPSDWTGSQLCCAVGLLQLSCIPICFQFFLTFTLSFLVTATGLCASLAISSASNCSNICSCHHTFFLILRPFALHYLLCISLNT